MATYLLTWNPSKWHWADLEEMSQQNKNGNIVPDEWSCGSTKKIRKGDRFFLMKLGKERDRTTENRKGLIASGKVVSDVKEKTHWDLERRRKGKMALYVEIEYDILLNPYKEEILSSEILPGNVKWFPEGSGIEIKDKIALEQTYILWRNFLDSGTQLPDELDEDEVNDLPEGAKKTIQVNVFERNPEARRLCIKKYGTLCYICKFNFNKTYGREIAEDYIHVHHLKPLSEIDESYQVHPIKDLRPVCPNCHVIIHRKKPAYSIEQVREFIETQKNNDNCN